MERTALEIAGDVGSVPNTFFRQPNSDHLAVLYPGYGYTCQMPLLYYTSRLLRDLGADVLQVEYDYGAQGFRTLPEAEQDRLFFGDVRASYRAAAAQRAYRQVTLVGKSLGTHALSYLLSERAELGGARAVWLTPLLHDPDFVRRLERCPQRSLFVIGTADPAYNAERLRALARTPQRDVEVIDGADHSLELDDLDASLDALRRTASRTRAFLKETP